MSVGWSTGESFAMNHFLWRGEPLCDFCKVSIPSRFGKRNKDEIYSRLDSKAVERKPYCTTCKNKLSKLSRVDVAVEKMLEG